MLDADILKYFFIFQNICVTNIYRFKKLFKKFYGSINEENLDFCNAYAH